MSTYPDEWALRNESPRWTEVGFPPRKPAPDPSPEEQAEIERFGIFDEEGR